MLDAGSASSIACWLSYSHSSALLHAAHARATAATVLACAHISPLRPVTLQRALCSRPTAVNLLDASRKLHTLVAAELAAPDASAASVTAAVINSAEAMQQADIDANRALGAHGRAAMLAAAKPQAGAKGASCAC